MKLAMMHLKGEKCFKIPLCGSVVFHPSKIGGYLRPPELHRHLEAILSKLRLKCDVINISLEDQLEHAHSK